MSYFRWLLDTDQDAEGMKVIADLYGGGNPNNKHARREFREIKEAVLADVCDQMLQCSPSCIRTDIMPISSALVATGATWT